ncbi:MAG TPA: tetratricopeptide repeat protein [Candidatus Coprenecus stercoravium]|uniref:Tetratricopeptide repeat protein n=1 Tax=Candidatus Coprenecus stercoravium TaxID=2840735 RepID=A0A9D2GRS5_9BACT|nr:tetratricopeptide repeat protein [Candidatus Coprenecus stercoravium]
MAKNINNPNAERNEKVGEAVSQTEEFFKKNGKTLSYTGVGLILVAAIIILIIQFYSKPLKAEAVDQTYTAEQYFRAEDYDKALNGDGNALGFAQIIDEYGAKAGKAVYFYAGVCELQLGNAAEAISYLEKYKGKEPVIKARALACTGDAYSMLEDYGQALSYYLKAAEVEENVFAASYLLKAGIICEETGRLDEALDCYRTIKDKYPQSFEGYEIDKYISRIEVKK